MTTDLAQVAKSKGIKYFLISFVDLFGTLRAKLVPASAIKQMQRDGAGFAGFAVWLDMTPAHPDMFGRPDPDSLIQLPWNREIGWLAADLWMNGAQVEASPRVVLKRQIEAAAKLDSVLRTNPEFAEAVLLKGRLEGLRGDAVAAETWILKHLELDKNSAQGWFQLGLVRLKQERTAEADAAFKRAIELKSDFGAAHFNRAVCLANLGRTNESVASLEQSIRHNPEHFDSYLYLADLHFRAGNLDAGFVRLHQARQLNPKDPRLRSLMERAGNRNLR